MTHPLMTEEEYADLFIEGKAPQNCIRMVMWAWYRLPKHLREDILTRQPVILFDRDNFGVITAEQLRKKLEGED